MDRRKKVIYVSGRYTAPTLEGIDKNISDSMEVAAQIWDMGYTVICPVANTAYLELKCKNTGYEEIMAGDFELLKRSDAIHMVHNWIDSSGAKRELVYMVEELRKPGFFNLDQLGKWQLPEWQFDLQLYNQMKSRHIDE